MHTDSICHTIVIILYNASLLIILTSINYLESVVWHTGNGTLCSRHGMKPLAVSFWIYTPQLTTMIVVAVTAITSHTGKELGVVVKIVKVRCIANKT